MSVLFVCRGNMFRSQIAEVFYNRFSKSENACSAGTWVVKEGNEDKKMKQVTEAMVDESEKIIVMAEEETWPDFLRGNSKVIFWGVDNPSLGESEESFRVGRELKNLVRNLLP